MIKSDCDNCLIVKIAIKAKITIKQFYHYLNVYFDLNSITGQMISSNEMPPCWKVSM